MFHSRPVSSKTFSDLFEKENIFINIPNKDSPAIGDMYFLMIRDQAGPGMIGSFALVVSVKKYDKVSEVCFTRARVQP